MADKDRDQFWDLVKNFRTCMMTTVDSGIMRSRPLAPLTLGHNKSIYFLTARSSHKMEELNASPQCNLSFVDDGKSDYVSVSGTAEFSDDLALKKELWNEMASLWFKDGPEDPEVVVLVIEPVAAEYWDGRQNIVRKAWEFAKAKLTDLDPDLGKNRKVKFA